MPTATADYPPSNIAEAGRTYTFPYNFVIPDQLLPRACNHRCITDYVTNAHLQLPPSMGDRTLLAGQSDMAPEMTKVQYAIKVQVVRRTEEVTNGVILAESAKQILVIPAQMEAPPLSVEAGDSHFTLSKTKALRKGMFSGKLGKITVSAAQPGAIILPSPSASASTSATTMATVNLRFDPHDSSSQPPRLGGLSTKIKSSTFFAVIPATSIPTHRHAQSPFKIHRGVYDSTVNISSRCVESVQWKSIQQPPGEAPNPRPAPRSSQTAQSQPITKNSAAYYSATILVPINPPIN